jgi:hypothetical protein
VVIVGPLGTAFNTGEKNKTAGSIREGFDGSPAAGSGNGMTARNSPSIRFSRRERVRCRSFSEQRTAPDSHGARRLFGRAKRLFEVFPAAVEGLRLDGAELPSHLIQFMTTENGKWHGPARSHLTVYVGQ